MEQLIGMQMMMSLIQLLSYEMHWNTSLIENTASIIPIKRYGYCAEISMLLTTTRVLRLQASCSRENFSVMLSEATA